MSKPTQGMVNIAEQLYEYGYRQEFKRGDWAVCKDDGKIFLIVDLAGRGKVSWYYSEAAASGLIHEDELIPVPSLDDALDWLNENDKFYILSGTDVGAVLKTHLYSLSAESARRVALMAMFKVISSKEKKEENDN